MKVSVWLQMTYKFDHSTAHFSLDSGRRWFFLEDSGMAAHHFSALVIQVLMQKCHRGYQTAEGAQELDSILFLWGSVFLLPFCTGRY